MQKGQPTIKAVLQPYPSDIEHGSLPDIPNGEMGSHDIATILYLNRREEPDQVKANRSARHPTDLQYPDIILLNYLKNIKEFGCSKGMSAYYTFGHLEMTDNDDRGVRGIATRLLC